MRTSTQIPNHLKSQSLRYSETVQVHSHIEVFVVEGSTTFKDLEVGLPSTAKRSTFSLQKLRLSTTQANVLVDFVGEAFSINILYTDI